MSNNTKYGLHGKLTAKTGKGNELAQILLEAAELMKSASGCHLYVVGRSDQHAEEVWVTEIWDTKEDHDQSLTAPEVRALIGRAMPLLGGPPQKGQELDILGGLGIS